MLSKCHIIRALLCLLGFGSLIFSISYYSHCRSDILLTPFFTTVNTTFPMSCEVFFAGSIPAISHQLTMIFFSTSLSKNLNIVKWSLFWLSVNIIFELGQLIDQPLHLFPNYLNNYLVNGTFDIVDLISFLLVAVVTSSLYFPIKIISKVQ